MITEDNYCIYIDNKKDIENLHKLNSSRYGSNSDIFIYNKELIKIYTYLSCISEYYNIEKMRKLNIKNVAIPKKIIYLNNRFSGYSMDYMKGIILPRVNDNTNYDLFIANLDKIEKTIKIFSNNKIEMRDINCFNILYDEINNEFNIVDVDCYKENQFISTEKIYKDNLFYFENTLLNSLYTKYSITNTKLYESIKNIMTKGINNNFDIINIFKTIKIYLENYSNSEINTIKDFRKVLKKYDNH